MRCALAHNKRQIRTARLSRLQFLLFAGNDPRNWSLRKNWPTR